RRTLDGFNVISRLQRYAALGAFNLARWPRLFHFAPLALGILPAKMLTFGVNAPIVRSFKISGWFSRAASSSLAKTRARLLFPKQAVPVDWHALSSSRRYWSRKLTWPTQWGGAGIDF